MTTSRYRFIYSRTTFPVKIRWFWAFCECAWQSVTYILARRKTTDSALRKSLSRVAEKPVWGDDMYRFVVRDRHFRQCVTLFPYIKKPFPALRVQISGYSWHMMMFHRWWFAAFPFLFCEIILSIFFTYRFVWIFIQNRVARAGVSVAHIGINVCFGGCNMLLYCAVFDVICNNWYCFITTAYACRDAKSCVSRGRLRNLFLL